MAGAIGGIEQRKISDPVIEERRFLNGARVEALAKLRRIGPNLAGDSGDGHFRFRSRDVELKREIGRGPAGQGHIGESPFGESRLIRGDGVDPGDGETGDGEVPRSVGLRGAVDVASGVGDLDLDANDGGMGGIGDVSMDGRGVGGLGGEEDRERQEEECSGHEKPFRLAEGGGYYQRS